jgi:uncharacterized membrane protein YkvA (DUF1232 family)
MKQIKKAADYAKYYSESDLFKKLKKVSGSLGYNLLFYIFVLYFLIADKTIPVKVRLAFVAALGYFIFPLDLLNDFLPVIGYSDDMALLTFVIGNASNYITPEIKEKAKALRTAIIGEEELPDQANEEEAQS